MNFPTNYKDIIKRVENISPKKYCKNRNFIDGDVTYLSPYISRGVISTKLIYDICIKKGYAKKQHYSKKSFPGIYLAQKRNCFNWFGNWLSEIRMR